MVVLFSIIGVIVVVVVAFVLTGTYINLPTKGNAIAAYDNPKSALLVIDVQNDITNNGAYSGTGEFVDNVNQAIAFAEESGMEILYVKNEYGNNPIVALLSQGTFKSGTQGAEFDRRLNVVNGNIFTKSVGDSFSVSGLENYLIASKVDALYIVGADMAACVYSTAKGGLNRNYDVTVIEDAVITRDAIRNTQMQKLTEQYEKDGIRMIGLNEFIN